LISVTKEIQTKRAHDYLRDISRVVMKMIKALFKNIPAGKEEDHRIPRFADRDLPNTKQECQLLNRNIR